MGVIWFIEHGCYKGKIQNISSYNVNVSFYIQDTYGVLIRLKDKIDVLNFFSKYGYELATSDTESYGVVSGSVIIPVGTTSLTLMKVKQ